MLGKDGGPRPPRFSVFDWFVGGLTTCTTTGSWDKTPIHRYTSLNGQQVTASKRLAALGAAASRGRREDQTRGDADADYERQEMCYQ
jgi:hypothetical protein